MKAKLMSFEDAKRATMQNDWFVNFEGTRLSGLTKDDVPWGSTVKVYDGSNGCYMVSNHLVPMCCFEEI